MAEGRGRGEAPRPAAKVWADGDDLAPDVELAVDRSCVVVSLPHTGLAWPRALGPAPRVSLPQHADHAVDLLYEGAPATIVRARWSRLVVDLNRAPDDINPEIVPDHPAPRPRLRPGDHDAAPGPLGRHRGVIWTHAFGEIPLVLLPLSAEHVTMRIQRYHKPYWDSVERAMERARAQFGRCCLLDAHSMPSVAGGDIVLGTLDGSSCRPEVLECALELLRSRTGLRISVDRPYRGGAILRRFGRPQSGHDALQVEVNRALYMDEVTLRPWLSRCDAPSHHRAHSVAQRRMVELHLALRALCHELHLLCSESLTR